MTAPVRSVRDRAFQCALAAIVLGTGLGAVACGSSENATSSSQGGGLITGASTSNSGSGGSTSSSTAGSGGASGTTTGNGGAGGGGGDIGVGGAGGDGGSPPTCNDLGVGEPNETETNAFQLPGQSDCQSAAMVTGTIAGIEEDWFQYAGDDALCSVNPERQFSQDGGLLICKYFECDKPNSTVVDCPSSTTAVTSPGGRPGCCSDQGFGISAFSLTEGVECSGTIDDNMTVYLQVRAETPSVSTCSSYSISYTF